MLVICLVAKAFLSFTVTIILSLKNNVKKNLLKKYLLTKKCTKSIIKAIQNKNKYMLLSEQAKELLETEAPISNSKVSVRYQFVALRARGLSNEDISDKLNVSIDLINELDEDLEEEFFA
jgi:DNA-binding NarL/FixJ family response regulator